MGRSSRCPRWRGTGDPPRHRQAVRRRRPEPGVRGECASLTRLRLTWPAVACAGTSYKPARGRPQHSHGRRRRYAVWPRSISTRLAVVERGSGFLHPRPLHLPPATLLVQLLCQGFRLTGAGAATAGEQLREALEPRPLPLAAWGRGEPSRRGQLMHRLALLHRRQRAPRLALGTVLATLQRHGSPPRLVQRFFIPELPSALVQFLGTIIDMAAELGEFIQKEHAIMGQRDLARHWHVALTDQPHI